YTSWASANCSFFCRRIANETASSSVNSRVDDSDGSMSCPARSSAPTPNAVLADFVGLDVELEMNPRIEGAVSLLRLELPVDFGELQAHGLRSRLATGGALHHASDDDVAHLDDEELLLPFARLPKCDGGFLQVLTRRAGLQQLRRRLVDFVNDGKILERRLAGTPAAAAGRNVCGVCDTPGVR